MNNAKFYSQLTSLSSLCSSVPDPESSLTVVQTAGTCCIGVARGHEAGGRRIVALKRRRRAERRTRGAHCTGGHPQGGVGQRGCGCGAVEAATACCQAGYIRVLGQGRNAHAYSNTTRGGATVGGMDIPSISESLSSRAATTWSGSSIIVAAISRRGIEVGIVLRKIILLLICFFIFLRYVTRNSPFPHRRNFQCKILCYGLRMSSP